MSINRIQKLLFSEYCEFEDMVLVESPFAQTTRDGEGLRQVHLGLTKSKLVLATDVLPKATESSICCLPGIDPDVETFELVAVYPIECVNLSVFHRRKKQSLKARFSNEKVLYFELGGFEKRNILWNIWCEQVHCLNPKLLSSAHSETSVATSSTNSTLYLQSSRQVINKNGNLQFWYEYGAGDQKDVHNSPKWTDRTLFIGHDGVLYAPKMVPPTVSQFVLNDAQRAEFSKDTSGDHNEVRRFGSGISENCNSGVFIPADNFIVNQKFSASTTKSVDVFTMYNKIPKQSSTNTYSDMAENCVKMWEFYRQTESNSNVSRRHRRRYGLSPQPHFLNGLGPWNVNPGERFSVQVKRAQSLVTIRRQPNEPELRLPVSKRQLIATVSYEKIYLDKKIYENTNTIKLTNKSPVILFWTPEYWYRPRSAKEAYLELQTHLNKIREYRDLFDKKKNGKGGLFKRWKKEDESKNKNKRFLGVFSKTSKDKSSTEVSPLHYLKNMLKIDIVLTAWDFDSTTLAYQLTVIERDLFLKIPSAELSVLCWQQSSKNAPNIGAVIAFSHRISCLVCTEVLRDDSEKIRARLIARFINTAEKCNRISNFQSCKSVLSGLQSPPVYRLKATWNYLRKKHATIYQVFETLCRQYRDPRLKIYQKTFKKSSETVPYIPFIGDVICRMLDRIPGYDEDVKTFQIPSPGCVSATSKSHATIIQDKKSLPIENILKRIFFLFKIPNQMQESKFSHNNKKKKRVIQCGVLSEKQLSLTDYYKPLGVYEDNRVIRLKEVMNLLDQYHQAAAHYNIPVNVLAREYLLKARYREERENFLHSLQVEPPT